MVALFGAFTWLSIQWQRSWLLEEVRRGLSLASDTLHSSLRDGMMQNQREVILGTIERVARDTRIKQIRIIQHHGRVALSAPGEDLDRQVDPSAPSCTFCHEGGAGVLPDILTPEARTILSEDVMMAFTPVLAEPGCITGACHESEADSEVLGVIDLSLSLDDVEAALARNQLQLASVSVAATLLGGGLIWLALARRFRRPMRDMLRGIRRVANGDLIYRIPRRVADEFGELAVSFNAMSRQLDTVQQGLIQSERLISMGKLAAGVAHEINNPLTGILSYAEDLMEGMEPSDPRYKDYKVIVHEALRCRQIVRGLLDFARQDAPRLTHIHPRELIESALDVLRHQAVFRNIQFQLDRAGARQLDRQRTTSDAGWRGNRSGCEVCGRWKPSGIFCQRRGDGDTFRDSIANLRAFFLHKGW
jgi:two-component system NtrC family sensor kinase